MDNARVRDNTRVKFSCVDGVADGASVVLPFMNINGIEAKATKWKVWNAFKESHPILEAVPVSDHTVGKYVLFSTEDKEPIGLNDSTSLSEYIKWASSVTSTGSRFVHATIRVAIVYSQLPTRSRPQKKRKITAETVSESTPSPTGTQIGSESAAEEPGSCDPLKELKDMFSSAEGLTEEVQNKLLQFLAVESADPKLMTAEESELARKMAVKGRLLLRLYQRYGVFHKLKGDEEMGFQVVCSDCEKQIKLSGIKLSNFNQHIKSGCRNEQVRAQERDLQKTMVHAYFSVIAAPLDGHLSIEERKRRKEQKDLSSSAIRKVQKVAAGACNEAYNQAFADFVERHLDKENGYPHSMNEWTGGMLDRLRLDELRLLIVVCPSLTVRKRMGRNNV